MSIPRKRTPTRSTRDAYDEPSGPSAERYLLFPLGEKGTAALGGAAAVDILTALATDTPARYALFPVKKKLAQATAGALLLFELEGQLKLEARVDKVTSPDHYGAAAREKWTAAGAKEIETWTVLRDVRPVEGAALEKLVASDGKELKAAALGLRILAVRPKEGAL